MGKGSKRKRAWADGAAHREGGDTTWGRRYRVAPARKMG
jgi:hypothetical protein